MISKILSRTVVTLKQNQAFKTSLVFQPKKTFFWTSSDCYSRLNISKNATKEEINAAYHSELRKIQSQQRSSRQEKDIQDLRAAQDEALRKLKSKPQYNEDDTFRSNNNSQQSQHSYQNQEQQNYHQNQQQFQQNNQQQKRGWFKEFLLAQSYGKKPNAEQKQWGMEIFFLSILGITGICYVIGSNLKDHSKYNQDKPGARVILTHKDLDIAKQQYAQYQEYKKEQQQIQQQQQQMQQDAQNQQVNNESSNIQGYFGNNNQNNNSSSNSSFDKEFEEYKKKSSHGFFGGKDE